MKMRLLLCLLAAATVASGGEAVETARRSLPFVKEQGVAWIKDRECASCHQVPAMLWSLNSAVKAGIDEGKETAEWTPWAADWKHWSKSSGDGVDKVSSVNVDTMVWLLLGRDAAAPVPAEMTDYRAQILKNQQADGSWKAQGQLPFAKRPPREIHEVTTMWTLLALQGYAGQEVPAEMLKKADDYLAKAQPGLSTEWHVLKLLLKTSDAGLREALLKLQHDDGGWGWLSKDPSDAFGTGMALYALARSGLPTDHAARQKAVQFLKKTQQPDGSWAVPSTRARDNNKVNKTATYWGTAWAVIGLLETPGKNVAAAPESVSSP